MSLINDALKKAQKMRTQDQAFSTPSLPNGNSGPVAKRSRPMSTRMLVGIVAGAAVLMAGSVLTTVFWLRQPEPTPAPKPAATPASVSEAPPPKLAVPSAKTVEPPPAPELTTAAPTPLVAVAPPATVNVTAPVAPKTETPLLAALSVAPAALPVSTPPPSTDPANALPASTPTVTSTAIRPVAPPAPAKHDPRAQAFVDALRVTGIRASGSDSKVLMNDRVFRVNDIVERSLGLRLTVVAADRLSFTDENGVVYTRNF